jgi:hypothetical protein
MLCAFNSGKNKQKYSSGSFAFDQLFLEKHTDAITLRKGDAAVVVVPAYQGRVMTSTYDEKTGPGFGWINHPVIEKGFLSDEKKKGKPEEHIYIFGGEERFWLGPEGGQYGLFFKPGDPFVYKYWKTPAAIDTEAFELVSFSEESATFRHNTKLENYSGTIFNMGIKRTVQLLDKKAVEQIIGEELTGGIRIVAYETDNRLYNRGEQEWNQKDGLPSIWILGMYKPSPNTTIVIPFKSGSKTKLGPKVNDNYFGKVPPAYLNVKENVLFLKGDGTYRSKIGISAKRSLGLAGSYDANGKVLTLVTYNVQNAPDGYVNSMWEFQDEPYNGDVINAYNDGAPAPGEPPLGPFYELETSSPAAALAPGESMQHVQRTIHLHASEEELNTIALHVLGVTIEQIKKGV